MKKHGIRKVVAILVVIIFVLLIVGGLIKAHYIRKSFAKPTQQQVDSAAKIAKESLKSEGMDPAMFQMQSGSRLRVVKDERGVQKLIMQISFYNNSANHVYLIDVNSGKILLRSETDFYEPLDRQNREMPRHIFWLYQRFGR